MLKRALQTRPATAEMPSAQPTGGLSFQTIHDSAEERGVEHREAGLHWSVQEGVSILGHGTFFVLAAHIAHSQVLAEGDVWGGGVVPVDTALQSLLWPRIHHTGACHCQRVRGGQPHPRLTGRRISPHARHMA
jgi:hypothetical protein